MRLRSFLVVSAVLSVFCAQALADLADSEGKAPEETAEETAEANAKEAGKPEPNENITYLAVSAELASIAREMKDPVLMLAAAHLEAMAVTKAEPKEKATEGEAKTEDSEKVEQKALYALAEEYAGSNETLLALIGDNKGSAGTQRRGCGPRCASMGVRGYADDGSSDPQVFFRGRGIPLDSPGPVVERGLPKPGSPGTLVNRGLPKPGSPGTLVNRGRSFNPISHWDIVRAGRTDVYRERFEGGKFAEVAISGDGDTDLDLYIYDQNGNRICSDIDYGDQAYCSWWPQRTGSFRIEIINLGSVYNEYMLLTN